MENIVTEKKCSICKRVKFISEFYKNKTKHDGLGSICKICSHSAYKKWSKENPDKAKNYSKEWMIKNKEYVKGYQDKYRKEHPRKLKGTRIRLVQNLTGNTQAERAAESARLYYERNVQKERERQRKYAKLHPEQYQAKRQNRRAREKNAVGRITEKEWKSVLDKYGRRCLCCRRDDVTISMDHVVPLAVGGTNTVDNVQPLCRSCNSKKGTKTIDYRKGVENA